MQDRFKQILKDKKLTAAQFATMIKVNPSAMSHILNGRSKPGFDVLDKIGQTFPEINLNWLISGKGEPYTNTNEFETFKEKNFIEPTESSTEPQTDGITQEIPQEEEIVTKIPTEVTASQVSKTIKRIILFFDNGTFEVYEN